MSDFNYTGYEQRKRAAVGGYGAKAAQNAYAQFLSQQRGSRKKFDLQQQYETQTPRLISSFSKRGLAGPGVKSGIFQKGLSDYASKNLRDINDLDVANTAELENLKFQDMQNKAELDQQIAALEMEKQMNIANAAATLQAFKPFLGG